MCSLRHSSLRPRPAHAPANRFSAGWVLLLLLLVPRLSAQTTASRLLNLSTRGQVGTGANAVDGGFAIAGGGKTVLLRAIGPGLAQFGVPATLPDPVLMLYGSQQTLIATNDNWDASSGAYFAQVGAFSLPIGSTDAALVVTLQPGTYSAVISGNGTQNTGTALLEIYDVSGPGQLINVSCRLQMGSGNNAAAAGLSIGSGSGARKLLIRGIGPGLAQFGLPGTIADPKLVIYDANGIAVAQSVANGAVGGLAAATAQAGAFAATAGDAATIVTLNPGLFTAQVSSNSGTSSGVGLVEVYDVTGATGIPSTLAGTPLLYYASLRPTSGASSSAAGYATILFDPNTGIASVSLSFSNLTSTEVAAHLVVGGGFVFGLPSGQVAEIPWSFPAAGASSTANLVQALQNGSLSVEIDSANFPGGELTGSFVLSNGSQAFTPPSAPPSLGSTALSAPTQTDAARLLTQATFGAVAADIGTVMSRGIVNWIGDQMALPPTLWTAGTRADAAAFPNPPAPPPSTYQYVTYNNAMAAWWKTVLTAPDQLRQRVAFALSEILVVGDMCAINAEALAKTSYYDLLVNDAFGNFRQLLQDVTLNPVMGTWLSHISNQKANPLTGTSPDENYAREVQQLFTIGLVQLQPDGSLLLDSSGQPIPTYNQATITQTAAVFTGWSFATGVFGQLPPSTSLTIVGDDNAWLNPMVSYAAYHDETQKNVVSLQQVPLSQSAATVIPANQSADQDLKVMLDTLFNHPNTGPFFCRQLIQRLVTSNPSAGYVYRVSQVFANDGTGVRGNLAAVVQAILTDYEARSPAVIGNVGYGKLKEPLIRATAFFRALNASAPNGRYLDSYFGDPREPGGYYPSGFMAWPMTAMPEGPLTAPTVFNFFSPSYSPPGPIAAAGLVAPEMQLMDEYDAIAVPNTISNYMYRPASVLPPNPPSPSPFIVLDYSAYLPNVRNPSALLDQLSLIFCANGMTAGTRAQITAAMQSLAQFSDLAVLQAALYLTLTSPDCCVQL